MNSTTITILDNHCVRTGRVSALPVSIDGQNGVDTLEFIVPESMADWAWRVEIEQNGKKTWRMMEDGHVWTVRAGEVVEGYGKIQAVASRQGGETTLCWKTREFDICVFPSINASEAVTPGEASALDEIAAQVKSDADRADAAATRAEDAAAGAENIVNSAVETVEAEGEKQAAAVASSGTQALEAIGQVEQTAIAQVQAAGTAQVGAVEDAGDGKLAQIDAANAHAPQINEATGKWQVWDTQTGAFVDTDTDAQGPRGKTGATGPQGPAGADGIGLPVATAEDAGKVPVVNTAGTGYELGDPIPEVDTTLTEAGAPADAAATGNAIEAITPDDESVGAKPWTSKQIIDALCPPLEATGNPVQCYPVSGYPLGVKATWQPRQAGTGDPSPDNIRPITGLDEVIVQRSGKNLMPYTKPSESSYTSKGVTFTWNDDGSIHVSGTAVGRVSSNVMYFDDFSLPPGAYRMIPSSQSGVTLQFVVKKGSTGTNIWYGSNSNITIENGDVPQYFYVTVADGVVMDTTVYAFLSYGTDIPSADDYEPYTGTTATLALPSTVYGGEVDLATGHGQETWEYMEFDGTEDWYQNDQSGYFLGDVIDIGSGGRRESKSNIAVNSVYEISPIPNGQFNIWSFTTQLGWVGFSLSFADSLDSWKSYLAAQYAAGTPVTVAYKLATPQPITATGGQQINALAGVNTVITNGDSVTVTGRADPVATVQVLADRVAALEQAAVNAIGG